MNRTEGCDEDCGCEAPSLTRRALLQLAGAGVLTMMNSSPTALAGPFEPSDFDDIAPANKKLDPQWVKSLFERGAATVYRGGDLKNIGMPVGGIAAGQLYLGGDGRLWHWDIFNRNLETDGAHYVHPLQSDGAEERPLEQGFALLIDGKKHRLDSRDFSKISFCGQYPIGRVEYSSPDVPLSVSLEAFSPFIPLNADDSSLPATIFQFTLQNNSLQTVQTTLVGWLQNAVCLAYPEHIERRVNQLAFETGATRLDCSAQPLGARDGAPDIVVEDWQKTDYKAWTVEGTAFGDGPIDRKNLPAYQGDVAGDDERVVNSHASAPGDSIGAKDAATGKLISKPFRIERDYLYFLLGGGEHPNQTAFRLLVDGKIVQTATGKNANLMEMRRFETRDLRGKSAVIEIVDEAQGSWGNIGVGRIKQSNRETLDKSAAELSDFGEMSLMLLGEAAQHSNMRVVMEQLEAGSTPSQATAPPAEVLIGSLGREVRLAPQESATISFALTWRFPNLSLPIFPKVGREYATRFDSSAAVARYVAANFKRLVTQTKLWRDTWTDSTLPHWFLERTFANTSTLATSTTYRFVNGRFYGWEGVGCCAGTCTHVWHYEQAMGRLFPELDINLRDRVDYKLNVGFHEDGVIGYRGELAGAASDGQAGTILRTLRDHQMSPDDAFLRRNWAHIKKAVEWMIGQDGNADGIWEREQYNTLDDAWYGEIPSLSGLYLAALSAAAQMAQEMNDTDFAAKCRRIAQVGKENFVKRMWNGEYFIQVADPAKAQSIGPYNGCYIDQVFGQSWAWQVGLGRVLPKEETKRALAALWRYNFTPDVGAYRKKHPAGRWFAVAGEGGLLMCSWPRGTAKRVTVGDFKDGYWNECMSGFEHQVAGHMMNEGMTTESLVIERAIHDRYHAVRRNPWNEIECGDHYARAMASYGVFLAACGYEYHGPKAHLGFDPKISPEKFKAAFTTAEGWGSYQQSWEKNNFSASIKLQWGTLRLQTFCSKIPETKRARSVQVSLDNKSVKATLSRDGQKTTISFSSAIVVQAGQTLQFQFIEGK